jgi:isopenicillin N synthase-like dioxygenase
MKLKSQNLDNHPVAKSNEFSERVPIIDIAELIDPSTRPNVSAKAREISEACRQWGFFQVINHGINPQLVSATWNHTRQFFNLPAHKKQSVQRTRSNPWGYYNNELTKNQRDKKEVFDFTHKGIEPIYNSANRWLDESPGFKTTMLNYFDACTKLSMVLLETFCVGIDLEPGYLNESFMPNHTGFIRLNYYPVEDPLKNSEVKHNTVADLGVHHHTDAGAFTLLLQDQVGGLQVYRNGLWHNILPEPGAIVVNTGDMMQVWSNDLYQAAIHRVLAMESKNRYSIPFFFNPAAITKISPLPSVVSKERPNRYSPIEWFKYRGQRTDGDYADYGTEIQISQFRKF